MTTTAPFRLLIQQRITAALKEITPGNGYVNDLSDFTTPEDGRVRSRVVRGVALFGDDHPLPLVSILQPPHPTDPFDAPVSATSRGLDWVLLVQGFVEDDEDNPTDPAEILMADVKQRLAKVIEAGAPSASTDDNILGLGGSDSPDVRGTGNAVLQMTIGNGSVRPSDELSSKAYFWLLLIVKIVENTGKPYGV